jgi:cytochrome c-type biogenesis protein CcmF
MAPLGKAILLIDLAVCVYGIVASVYGARTGKRDWVDSGRRAVYALAALSIIAFAVLESAFIRNDFSFNVVASSSSTTTPLFYKMAAPWSSQQGSLLLWVTLLSIWSSIVLFLTRHRMRDIAPYATAVLLGFALFFASLAAFAANPFDTTTGALMPTQGSGLDPLLMHPSMIIHPPMLYSGYTLMTIPLAFAVGALVSGNLGSEWIRDTRRFALAAWMFLGFGIILGARWSYTELGWGGYWGWDAVENAALMPWIVMTAFIHSIQIQEKRGMLKVWNVSLVILAGTLSIFGTFLVRSGVLDSIHAFGASTLGIPFVALLGVLVIGGISLIIYRLPLLRSEHQIDSLFSREAMFLLQNLILVAITFVIFWITLFPLISEAITGTKVSVGPPAFTPFVVPLALALVLLTGIGPMISWRRGTAANLRRNLTFPVIVGVLVLLVVGLFTDAATKPLALIMFGLGAFVIAGVVQEMYRGTAARHALTSDIWPVAFLALIRRNRRRYGGYTAHMGIAVLFIGIAASSSFQHSRNATLKPGQSVWDGGYKWTYEKPTASATSEKVSLGAVIDVTKYGKHITTLHTERGFYPSTDTSDGFISRFFDSANADSTVGLDTGPLRDIWSVVNSNLSPLANEIAQGDKVFGSYYNSIVKKYNGNTKEVDAALNKPVFGNGVTFWTARDQAVVDIVSQYAKHDWAVQFLFITSPLVMWLWIGALITLLGGIIAIWPAPLAMRHRSFAVYRARLTRELS